MLLKTVSYRTVVLIVILLLTPFLASADWDYSRSAIDVADITAGGPPKDGIPALSNPAYVAASAANFMRDDEQVLGVFSGGIAKAYPTRILSWHELVNDHFRDLPVLVSW